MMPLKNATIDTQYKFNAIVSEITMICRHFQLFCYIFNELFTIIYEILSEP